MLGIEPTISGAASNHSATTTTNKSLYGHSHIGPLLG